MDLDEWKASVHPWLVGLEASLDVDFTRRSLADLERVRASDGDDSPRFVFDKGEAVALRLLAPHLRDERCLVRKVRAQNAYGGEAAAQFVVGLGVA